MNKLVYIETGTEDVYLNFGTEHYIATESDLFERTNCDAAFLFWRTTPTLMVGKYQNVYEEINLKYAREHNINIVRRMSGGGTIYTDLGGWQFTFISPKNVEEISFAEYMTPVISALYNIGIDACFNGRNDILVGGKKISGNAQYKLGGKTVHHGSILFCTDVEAMINATTVADYKIISKGIKSVRERVTNIREHLPCDMSAEDFKAKIVSNIMRGGEIYGLTQAEHDRIAVIADERFRNNDAVYGKEPKFSMSKKAHFKGGMVDMKFDVSKGHISDCAIYGDFFAAVPASDITQALIGCLFERKSICYRLKCAGLENAFYNIGVDEIAKMMTE